MSQNFFDKPILNSPYEYSARHWDLDDDGQPTNQILNSRRRSELISPVPKPKKRKKASAAQTELVLGSGEDLSTIEQEYNPTPIINDLRKSVDTWRAYSHLMGNR